MAIDYSFLEDIAPKPQEEVVEVKTSVANVTIRVDADCMMQCDGEYIDIPLKAGSMSKTQLPTGQHLLEFFSNENPNIKIEKIVDFPEPNKNYLVIVNELKLAIAPPIPKGKPTNATPRNTFLEQLTQIANRNPLEGMGTPPLPPKPNSNKKTLI